jgi:hypothetical protein
MMFISWERPDCKSPFEVNPAMIFGLFDTLVIRGRSFRPQQMMPTRVLLAFHGD